MKMTETLRKASKDLMDRIDHSIDDVFESSLSSYGSGENNFQMDDASESVVSDNCNDDKLEESNDARDNYQRSKQRDYDSLHQSTLSKDQSCHSKGRYDDLRHSDHSMSSRPRHFDDLKSSTHSHGRTNKKSYSSSHSRRSNQGGGDHRNSRSSRSRSRRTGSHSPNSSRCRRSRRSSSRRRKTERRSPRRSPSGRQITRKLSSKSSLSRLDKCEESSRKSMYCRSADDLLSAKLMSRKSADIQSKSNASWIPLETPKLFSKNPLLEKSNNRSYQLSSTGLVGTSSRRLQNSHSASDLLVRRSNLRFSYRPHINDNEVRQQGIDRTGRNYKSLGGEHIDSRSSVSIAVKRGMRESSSDNDLISRKSYLSGASNYPVAATSNVFLRRCDSSGNSLLSKQSFNERPRRQWKGNAMWELEGTNSNGYPSKVKGLRRFNSSSNIFLDKLNSRNDSSQKNTVWNPFEEMEVGQDDRTDKMDARKRLVSSRTGLRRLGSNRNFGSNNPLLTRSYSSSQIQLNEPQSCGDSSVDDTLWRDASNRILLENSISFDYNGGTTVAPSQSNDDLRAMSSESVQRLNGVDNILIDFKSNGTSPIKLDQQSMNDSTLVASHDSSSNLSALNILCKSQPGYTQIDSPKRRSSKLAKLTSFAPTLFNGYKKGDRKVETQDVEAISYNPGTRRFDLSLAERVAEVIAKTSNTTTDCPTVRQLHNSASSLLDLDVANGRPQTSWEISA